MTYKIYLLKPLLNNFELNRLVVLKWFMFKWKKVYVYTCSLRLIFIIIQMVTYSSIKRKTVNENGTYNQMLYVFQSYIKRLKYEYKKRKSIYTSLNIWTNFSLYFFKDSVRIIIYPTIYRQHFFFLFY